MEGCKINCIVSYIKALRRGRWPKYKANIIRQQHIYTFHFSATLTISASLRIYYYFNMSNGPSISMSVDSLNDISVASWEANAGFWDDHMGDEGNEFFNVLEMPAVERFTAVKKGDHILDLATGSGLLARRLASLGAVVTATDASPNLIRLAEQRSTKEQASKITYGLLDVTKDADFDRMVEESEKVQQHSAQLLWCNC